MSVGCDREANEFAHGWKTVLTAALGTGLGVSALITYPMGLFVQGMGAEFGLSRTVYGLGVLGSTFALALGGAIIGRVVDREGPRRIAALGAILLAVGFAVFGLLVNSPLSFVALMFITGLIGSGSSPVPYARAVSHKFIRRRGFALGIMQTGIGVSAALVPPAVAYVIAVFGWRAGFIALSMLALLGLLPALAGLGGQAPKQAQAAPLEGAGQAHRQPIFWLLMAAFGTMAFAFAGMLPNFVPMLIDLGVAPLRAAALASLIGVSLIIVRLAIGWLADIIHAPWLAAGVCLLCAAGCVTLALGGASAAPIGAIAFGAAMGAEADLIGFLVAKYFPLQVYGRVYGWQYAGFLIFAGLGPVWVGVIADRTGSYYWALLVAAVLLLVAMIPFLLMPRTKREKWSALQ